MEEYASIWSREVYIEKIVEAQVQSLEGHHAEVEAQENIHDQQQLIESDYRDRMRP